MQLFLHLDEDKLKKSELDDQHRSQSTDLAVNDTKGNHYESNKKTSHATLWCY